MNIGSPHQVFAAAEHAALTRQLSRFGSNAELGQLEWLRRRRQGASWSDAPWDAIVAGFYRWIEDGRHELVRMALVDMPADEPWNLDRFLLGRMAGGCSRQAPDPEREPLLFSSNIAVLKDAEAMTRQDEALRAADELARCDGALTLLNTFVPGEETNRPDWQHQALPRTARDVVGAVAPPMPIFRDILDMTCAAAKARGLRHFGYFNSDILLTPIALDLAREAIRMGYECQGYTRTDVPSADRRAPADWMEIHLSGTDLFVVSTAWWDRHRDMVEDYVLGAYWWDCVFVGQMMVHSRFFYASHLRGLIFHGKHPSISKPNSPQAEYNGRLREQQDAGYYDVHTRYCDRLRAHITRNRCLPCIAVNHGLQDDKMTRFLNR